MDTWKELLFGNLVGFSAVLVIGFMLLMAAFFVVYFLRMSRPPTAGSAAKKPQMQGDHKRV